MKKIIIKNTIFLYFRMVITIFVSFYTSRIIIQSLGLTDFGLYTVIFGLVGVLSFLNTSLTAAMQRFFSIAIAKKDFSDLNEKFNVSLSIQLLSLLLLTVVADTIGVWFLHNYLSIPVERKEISFDILNLILLSFAFTVIQAPYNALIIAHEKMSVFAKLSLFEAGLKLFLAYLLTVLTFDKILLHCCLMVFFTMLVCFSYVIYCTVQFPEAKLKPVLSLNSYRDFINFSGWTIFGGMAVQVRTHGVNIILNVFFGTLVNSAYGILQQVQNVVNLFVMNFIQAINPQIFKSYASGELEKAHQIINFGSRVTFFLVMILVLPLLLLSDPLLKIWLGTFPEYTTTFIQISMLTLLIESMSMSFMAGIQATGQIKIYQLVVSSIYLLIIPFSALLFKIGFNPNSVFYLSLLISFFAFLIRLFFVSKLTNFDFKSYLRMDFLYSLITFAITLLVSHLFLRWFNPDQSIVHLFFSLLIISIFSVLTIFFIGLNSDEKNKLIFFLKRYFTKLG